MHIKNGLRALPQIDFLLVEDDLEWAENFEVEFDAHKKIFEAELKYELNVLRIDQSPVRVNNNNRKCLNPGEACIELLSKVPCDFSLNIQGILLDWELNGKLQKFELIERIKALRPVLPIYIMTSNLDVISFTGAEARSIEDVFYKTDIYADIYDTIARVAANFSRYKTSHFWEAYKTHIKDSVDTWHTPGHSGGVSFRRSEYINDFYSFFEHNVFKGDLSVSVEKLGSLLDSTGYVADAQEKAAKTFGAAKTFFVTNGSSTANKIIIQSLLRPGDSVIIDRNCHKSVHYGMIQSGAVPYFLESQFDKHYGIFAPPRLSDIKKAVDEANAKLLILTGCTYDGILSDISAIVSYCHGQNVKVMIDEAWFAYSRFHPSYVRFSALEAGADYVTHSSHKTLSAFSQASMIHVNDPDFDEDFFREIFYIYTSTSPQYHIIASLDVAATQMQMEGYKMISKALDLSHLFRKEVNKMQTFNLVGENELKKAFKGLDSEDGESCGFDTLKVLIDFSQTGLSNAELLTEIRANAKLEIEKSTHSTFLVLFTIGTKREQVTRLIKVLQTIEDRVKQKSRRKEPEHLDIPKEIKLEEHVQPSQAFFGPRERVSFDKALNRVSAALVTPYPPGIPFLIPGQLIDQAHIDYMRENFIEGSIEVHGFFDGEIYVTKS